MPTTDPDQPSEQPLPVGRLLAWADAHADEDIRDQAARARLALAGLRARHAADTELTAITTEAQELEERLAELRAREAELRPPTRKTKAKGKTGVAPRDYDDATVRAWARQHNIPVAPLGRVPRELADRWRAAQTDAPKPLPIAS